MAYFWSPNFRLSNFLHLVDAWVFRVACLFAVWGFAITTFVHPPQHLFRVMALLYLCYLAFQLVQVLPVMYFSTDRHRDARIMAVLPLAPFYQTFLRCARTVSILEELLFRRSYHDNFYPAHVREATWHW